MKDGPKYLSIGHTIASSIMLPLLDLFGNNFSFIKRNKKIHFLDFSRIFTLVEIEER